MDGFDLNLMMDEGQDRIKAAYLEIYDRLASIKKHFIPQNLFHINQNIAQAT